MVYFDSGCFISVFYFRPQVTIKSLFTKIKYSDCGLHYPIGSLYFTLDLLQITGKYTIKFDACLTPSKGTDLES